MYKKFTILIVLIFLAACSIQTKKTIPPKATPNLKVTGGTVELSTKVVGKVAIFPFADYSFQQDMIRPNYYGGNIKIIEEITDHFFAMGTMVAIQEDVNRVLVDQGVIKPIKSEYMIYGSPVTSQPSRPGTLAYEINNPTYSADMRETMMEIYREEQVMYRLRQASSPVLQGVTVGLSEEKVIEIGKKLDIDLIIRGRIIEFGQKDVPTMNIMYKGLIPLILQPIGNFLFGWARAEEYERGLYVVSGAALGAGIGALSDEAGVGSIIGGGVGLISALYPSGKKPKFFVQIRMYAQDAETGKVIWGNRVEVDTYLATPYSENRHQKAMFDKAVKQAVEALMTDLFKSI